MNGPGGGWSDAERRGVAGKRRRMRSAGASKRFLRAELPPHRLANAFCRGGGAAGRSSELKSAGGAAGRNIAGGWGEVGERRGVGGWRSTAPGEQQQREQRDDACPEGGVWQASW